MRVRVLFAAVAAMGFMSVAPAEAGKPQMTAQVAKYYMDETLDDKDAFYWNYADGTRLRKCERLSRVRIRCKAWWTVFDGEKVFRGPITVFYYRHRNGEVYWDSKYRITRIDKQCVAAGGRNCRKTYRAG